MSPPRQVPVTPEEMAASLATSARILAGACDRQDALADKLEALTAKVDALVTKLAGLERDQNRHELDPLGHRQSRVR